MIGVALSFAVGWGVGARGGPKPYRDFVDSVRTVRESQELVALLDIARRHLSSALHELGTMVETSTPDEDLVDKVRRIASWRPA